MTENVIVHAMGGYSKVSGKKIYPGLSTLTWEEGRWGSWQEEDIEDEQNKKRSGFMMAQVSRKWIREVCDIKE